MFFSPAFEHESWKSMKKMRAPALDAGYKNRKVWTMSSRAFTLHPGFQTPGSTVLRQRFGQALCKAKNGRRMVSGPQHQNSFHLLAIG